jgi:hypothetical protein
VLEYPRSNKSGVIRSTVRSVGEGYGEGMLLLRQQPTVSGGVLYYICTW